MKKSIAARIMASVMALSLVAQASPVSFANEAESTTPVTPVEEYSFVGIPAGATIENDGWQLSIEHSSPGFYFNRTATGWYDTQANNSLLQLAKNTRDYIGYELDVAEAGNYKITVATINALPQDYNIFVNGAQVGKLTKGATSHEVSASTFFKKGINIFKIVAPEGGSVRLSKIKLDWVSEFDGSYTYDFTADSTINTNIHALNFEENGIRFSNDLSTGLYAGQTKFNSATLSAVCFNERAGNYAGFDMMVDEEGSYDIIVNAENNASHSAEVEAIVNGTTNKAANGTSIGSFDTSHLKARKSDNHRTVHLAGTAALNEGYNVLQFKSVGTATGVNSLYFREGIALADPTAAATTEGSSMSFAKGSAVNATVTAPARGLYYLYIKGKVAANGFGGNVAAGGLTQYIDFNTAYYNEAAGKDVIRVVGPIWMDANKATAVSFTETCADATALELTSIELHEVKQTLWMIDEAVQNYSNVTIENKGWEVNKDSTPAQYATMMLGAQVLSGKNTVGYFNAHRDANATNLNLSVGQILFDIYVPVSGNYKISGIFNNRALSNNIDFVISDASVVSRVNLYQAEGAEYKSSDIAIAYLEEGVHTITIGGGENVEDNSKYLYMKSLTIDAFDGEVADSAELSLDKSELNVGDTAKATVSVKAGEAAFAGDYTVSFKSSDEEVAKVDAEGNVEIIGEGEANITAIVFVQGKKFSASAKLTAVVPEPEFEKGDINGDGKVNTRDVTALRRYLAGGYEDSITVIASMIDVNGDGRENTRDVAALRSQIAG